MAKQNKTWEKELNDYNFCCGGDYCDLNHDNEDRAFVRDLVKQEILSVIEEIYNHSIDRTTVPVPMGSGEPYVRFKELNTKLDEIEKRYNGVK